MAIAPTQSKLADQWIEIFRAGNYGDKGKYTESDLDQIASSYDPSFHEAPAVIGHPESNKPAYAWVERLRRVGNLLQAKLKQVDPNFEDGVKAGRYKKRSASFYVLPDGRRYLRHIGFLGAQPPEVKGMADAVFHEQHEFVELNFEESEMDEKTVKERFEDWFNEKFRSAKPETKTFSEDDVKRIAADVAKAAVDAAVKPIQAENAELKTKIAKFEEDSAAAKISGAAADAIAKLKSAGRWLPPFDKMGMPHVFAELAKSTVTVEFGEGDKKKSLSPLALLTEFMESLPKFVPGGKLFEPGSAKTTVAFSENPGSRSKVDANSVQLNELVNARVKEKNISFAEALAQVSHEHPELTVAGGIASGEV